MSTPAGRPCPEGQSLCPQRTVQDRLVRHQDVLLEKPQMVGPLKFPEFTPSVLIPPQDALASVAAARLIIAWWFASHSESAEHQLCHTLNGEILGQFVPSAGSVVSASNGEITCVPRRDH